MTYFIIGAALVTAGVIELLGVAAGAVALIVVGVICLIIGALQNRSL